MDLKKKIWEAADVLRGNLNASEYEGVVLGLIFLKYISDRFETKYAELQQDPLADPEDKDEYTAENVFFVPKGARWSVISADAHNATIGVTIDNALRLIEQENARLKGILPKNFARPELDKRRLGDVVDLFTNIQMHGAGEERDLLGRTYEYCLQKFASMEGKNAGEFYTPSCIVRTIVEILQPYNGRIYDPCCGSGGMFVQSAKFSELLSNALSMYLKGMLTNEEVINELIRIAQEIKTAQEQGNELGLTDEEKAFYDALTQQEKVREAYSNEQFIALTKELTETLRRNRTIDWNKRESAQADMRRLVKRLLRKYHYPPEGQEKALETVMAQCVLWSDEEYETPLIVNQIVENHIHIDTYNNYQDDHSTHINVEK